MNTHNNEHIEDDFLKALVSQTDEPAPRPDFTEQVMGRLPEKPLVEEKENAALRPWHYVAIAAALPGLLYVIVTFDLTAALASLSEKPGTGIDYLSMIGAVFSMFKNGFAAFHFSSITLVIILSGVLLFFFDRFLKKLSQKSTRFAS